MGAVNNLSFPSGRKCDVIPVPALDKKPIDLLVLVNPIENNKTSFFAAAGVCMTDSSNGRPVLGVYYLNFAFLKKDKFTEFFYFSVFAHEFAHILGF